MSDVKLTLGDKTYFPSIEKPISYEGRESDNPLAFKFYDANRLILGKPMKDLFRFATAYWHTFCGTGADPFGPGVKHFPWDANPDRLAAAHDKMDAAFEFITKIGMEYYCFHDVDVAPEGNSNAEFEKNFRAIVDYAKQKQAASGVKLLWGTANLFSHERYMNGASTNPDFHVLGARWLAG